MAKPYILFARPGSNPKGSKGRESKFDMVCFFDIILAGSDGHALETLPKKSSTSLLLVDGEFQRERGIRQKFDKAFLGPNITQVDDPRVFQDRDRDYV